MLYHISPFKIDNWKPRIPSTRLKNEDGNIERICMAESVIGCLTALTLPIAKARGFSAIFGKWERFIDWVIEFRKKSQNSCFTLPLLY